MYPNEALEKAKLKAVEIARTKYVNHDISHCNIEELQFKCTTCRRYIAHLQISEQYEKFKDRLYSYFSDPLEECVEKNYQYYSDIEK
jgi:hypothetical protein